MFQGKQGVFFILFWGWVFSFGLFAEEITLNRESIKGSFTLMDGTLTDIRPDALIINNDVFLRHAYVRFYKLSKDGSRVSISRNEIPIPCLVDVSYNKFSFSTESNPFKEDDKVVFQVVIKSKTPPPIIE